MFQTLSDSQELDRAIEASQAKPIVIFKHSNSCPFSARAQEQVANAKHDIDIYGIVVQYTKDLSEEIASRLDVKHASPQAIVVHKGKAVADYWRSDIQESTLKEQVEKLSEQAA